MAARAGPRRSGEALEVHDPVDLPAGTCIGREGLLPAGGGGGDLRPDEADDDDALPDDLRAEKSSDPILEAAIERRVQPRVAAVHPPDGPEARLRIEHPDRRAAICPGRKLDDVVIAGSKPAENGAQLAAAGELVPLRIALQTPAQPPMGDAPAAMEHVEIVAAVARRLLPALGIVEGKGSRCCGQDRHGMSSGFEWRGEPKTQILTLCVRISLLGFRPCVPAACCPS